MKISLIKTKATTLLETCKSQVVRIMVLLTLIGLIPSLFNDSENIFFQMIYFILSIAFLTFEHGFVVSSLKVARNNADSLSDDDIFVGFKRWKELFPTYLLSNFIALGITVLVGLLLIIVFSILFGSVISNMSTTIMSSILQESDPAYAIYGLMTQVPSLLFVFLLIFLIILVLEVVISGLLFAVPYLLEEYGMHNMQAIKESCSIMKGHVWDYIKLELSFVGWSILTGIMMVMILSIFEMIPILNQMPILGSMIASIISGIVSVYLYIPRYQVSKAILFEEIAYYRYNHSYNDFRGDIYGE